MHYNGCNYLSMLGLKLNHVSKRGHCSSELRIMVSLHNNLQPSQGHHWQGKESHRHPFSLIVRGMWLAATDRLYDWCLVRSMSDPQQTGTASNDNLDPYLHYFFWIVRYGHLSDVDVNGPIGPLCSCHSSRAVMTCAKCNMISSSFL